MAAYVISEVEILDAALAASYRSLAAASIAEYGGRYLTRGADIEVLEGLPSHSKLVIVEFPSKQQAEAWYRSPGYAAALQLRARALDRRLLLVEGTAQSD